MANATVGHKDIYLQAKPRSRLLSTPAPAPIFFYSSVTHGQVGVVEQEPVLFGGSILDNIRYGRPAASREEVEAAAAVANASPFIQVRRTYWMYL